MNSHLSLEEIHQWLSGERLDEVEDHLSECRACKLELHQLRSVLAGFRSSLEQSPVPAVSYSRVRPTLPRWILATAALALLVATPVYWNARQERAEEQARADELLLERIDASLSRSVPASMEPLMQLISKENQ